MPIETTVAEEARRLADAATPGPWQAEIRDYGYSSITAKAVTGGSLARTFSHTFLRVALPEAANAAFIAWCREGVPKLLAEIERLREDNASHLIHVDEAEDLIRQHYERATAAERREARMREALQNISDQINAGPGIGYSWANAAGGVREIADRALLAEPTDAG